MARTEPESRRETGQTRMDVLGLALLRLATHCVSIPILSFRLTYFRAAEISESC